MSRAAGGLNMGIDCTCTIGWASSQEFADELGLPALLTVEEFGDPPVDPFCPIHNPETAETVDHLSPSTVALIESAVETDPEAIAAFKRLFPTAREYEVPAVILPARRRRSPRLVRLIRRIVSGVGDDQ